MSRSFEYEKVARSIDTIKDVDTLRNMAKSYVKLFLKQKETIGSIAKMKVDQMQLLVIIHMIDFKARGKSMNPMFSRHQWELILRAVRERRGHEMCGTKWHREYGDIIISIENNLLSVKDVTDSNDDWNDFWSSDSRGLTSNSMY